MTKPTRRSRLEVRCFLYRGVVENLQNEARKEARSITQQLTVILSERYGLAIEDQYEVAET